MRNSTIAYNKAPDGAGISTSGPTPLYYTLIAKNTGADCAGGVTSAGHNLDGDGSCGLAGVGDHISVSSPNLGPLAANGGPTATVALLAGSPAIDATPAASCTAPNDQRGVSRPQGATCDIGAFELVPPKDPKVDHFKCYVPHPPILAAPPITSSLHDQFDGPAFKQVKVKQLYRFCNPARTTLAGRVAPIASPLLHLSFYKITAPPSANRKLVVSNEFGQQQMVIGSAEWLAVPTSKNSTTMPDKSALSHFKCYRVMLGKAVDALVDLTDQWRTEVKVPIGKPTIFCNPTIKVHGGTKYPIVNKVDHLTCYRRPPKSSSDIAKIRNQFNLKVLHFSGSDLLCVPTAKLQVGIAPTPPSAPPPPIPASSTIVLACPADVVSGAARVTGTLQPPQPGGPIVIEYTAQTGLRVRHTASVADDGTFADTLTPQVSGPWRAQAHWSGGVFSRPSDSATCSFTVR